MVRIALAIAALVAGQAIVWPIALELVEADRCATAGGSFDYERERCDFGDSHPGTAFWERHRFALLVAGAASLAGVALLLHSGKR